jgi:hypothetical protein
VSGRALPANPGNTNVSAVEYGTDASGNQNYSNIINLNGFGQITSTNAGSRLTDEQYLRHGLKLTSDIGLWAERIDLLVESLHPVITII